jgi:two-component system, chemotaxis family, sensor histidine kinase and response regulator WspE
MKASANALTSVFRGEASPHAAGLRKSLDALLSSPADRSALARASSSAASLLALAELAEEPLVLRVAGALHERLSAAERVGVALDVSSLAELRKAFSLCERALSPESADEQDSSELASLIVLEGSVAAPASCRPPPAATGQAQPLRNVQPAFAPRPDARLLELFRQDLENCAAQLGSDLVQLESTRDPELLLERLMRAAHSLKGAARAVGIDRLVELAHQLEECFVAAQRGELTLDPPRIDALLGASDALGGLAHENAADFEHELEERHDQLLELATQIGALRSSGLAAEPGRPGRHGSEAGGGLTHVVAELPAKSPDNDTPTDDRVVRVAARSIERLLGLSAEALVQARRTSDFNGALAQLKQRQTELLERLAAQAGPGGKELREQVEECRRVTAELAPVLDHYVRAIEDLTGRMYHEALKSRMRPFVEAVQSLPRLARDVARRLDKRVALAIVGERTQVDRDVLEALQMPLQHLVRNAIDHGIESPEERVRRGKDAIASLRIEARHHAGMLAISVTDDGRGVDLPRLRQKLVETERLRADQAEQISEGELLRFLFTPGLSTAARVTDVSGRGVGLDVVASVVEGAGGSVRVSTESGRGTTFHLHLPVTRSVIRALIVEDGGESYALPLMRVQRILKLHVSDVRNIEQRQCLELDGEYVGLVRAHELLETPRGRAADELVVLVISDRGRSFGVVVDRFIGEQDLVVRPLDRRLGKVPNLAAASLLNDGAPVLILDVDDLLRSIEQLLAHGRPEHIAVAESAPRPRPRVLVVDDSLIVRELHKQLLLGQGYEVKVAVDGADAWRALQQEAYQLVVSDVDMPHLNGFELVRRIKEDARLRSTPVIIVSYKEREEDRLKGLEAGADYYLTKSNYQDRALIEAVQDLLGAP